MAGSVKGIIVEIGGDTSGLQKALSKVNSATSSLSKELRGVNSLLKLDPKNTELVSEKQILLAQRINTTEEKLKNLKQVQEEAEKAMQDGTEISQENYRALQQEIIRTEQKLKEFKLEASKWTTAGKAIENFGSKIDNIGNKIDRLGGKLTARVTTPLIALGAVGTKSAIDFETAFTGVEKTVDGTTEQMERLKQGIKDLSTEIPSTTTEISAVAEAAGQLGIQTDNILSFSKAMLDLGNSTNLTAEEAASQLAKFANVTEMSQRDFDKLGSSIVDLGNNFATTEADIVNMSMRLAGAGHQVGMSQGQILGIATALSSVGIEAEMGGSAISKAMVKMQNAVEQGGNKLNAVLKKTGMSLRDLELLSANNSKDFKKLSDSIGMTSTEVKQLITAGTNLEDFANVSGMTAEQFKKAWKEDASGALTAFIKGLGDAETKGESAITMLSEMGLTEVRLRDSLLRAANAGDLFNNAIKKGTKAWDENVALTNEANKRYETLESRLKTTKNKFTNLATNLGNKLTPSINKLLDKLDKFIEKLDNLSEEETENIIKVGLMIAAIGPAIKILGKLTTVTGKTFKAIGTFSQAIGVLKTGVESTSTKVNNLAKVIGAISSPIGLAAIGITTTVGIIVAQMKKAEEQSKKTIEIIGNSASDFMTGIDNATSHLSSFNSTLFATSEEQQKLQEQMDEIQKGITNICKTASDERRGYTQKEIKQLDEYFYKLRELKNREIEIQNNVAKAISQQAITNVENFKGTLYEYEVQSQEWIKTAQEQRDATIDIIKDGTTQEIVLLNQRYGSEANMQNEAYETEYNKIMEQQQSKIDMANQEVAKVNEVYANGYLERAKQDDGFYNSIKEHLSNIENEQGRHNKRIKELADTKQTAWNDVNGAIRQEGREHDSNMKKIYDDMYKNMSEEQAKELGVWLARLANTEMYGGKISDENQAMIDTIMDSYDSMPKNTKKVMKDSMQGMLNGMKDDEPALFAKATSIANGILSRLKKAFDIHSPSKETRKIFDYVMKGAEKGLSDEESKLYKQTDNISKKLLSKFEGIGNNLNLGSLNKSVIEQTKTIFTTPQITFNVQELDEARLQQCFNYINRKFGSAY